VWPRGAQGALGLPWGLGGTSGARYKGVVPGPIEIAVALVLGVPVWIVGLHVFDGLHWVLHGMLRSRWRVVRWLAAPHAMHHRWLDAELRICWENQAANFWGHIVLEYTTQLVFSAALLLVLPAGMVAAAVLYQTLVFAYIVSQRGLDPNHRPIEMLDAYKPSFLALPAYHALHHVYPDAYYSAYSKLIDYLVGGGIQLRGRRLGVTGAESSFGQPLCSRLAREGVAEIVSLEALAPHSEDGDASLATIDILLICDPTAPRVALVEAFVRATCRRQLPPEVWAVHTQATDRLARHYYDDPRVTYRAIVAPEAALHDPARAARAAAVAAFFIRRGFNFVPTAMAPQAVRDFRAFRRTAPAPPEGARLGLHRLELAAVAA
jgi:monoglucosyldiacylglycerol epimerase